MRVSISRSCCDGMGIDFFSNQRSRVSRGPLRVRHAIGGIGEGGTMQSGTKQLERASASDPKLGNLNVMRNCT